MHCIGKVRDTGEITTNLFSRHAELDVVDANLHMLANDLTHLFGPVCESCDAAYKLAVSTRHFLAVGEVSWSGNITCVDGISNDDIESLFRGGRPKAPVSYQHWLSSIH